jgi:hypothetical protein
MQEKLLRETAYAEFQEVTEHLYIGSQISSLNPMKLKEHDIKLVYRVNGIS